MSVPPEPILGLHHAQITVPKGAEEAARAFYCGVMRLPEILKPPSLQGRGGFWLRVGDREVHVGTEDGFDRTRTKAHLAYQVSDAAAWRAHLTRNGIEPLDSVPIEGYERFEFRDPFGNRCEIIQPLKK
jgi:catechol 2,3-dioxygenase-like lactoylglutathione lyase family enzyme